jgi:hypothetical protein
LLPENATAQTIPSAFTMVAHMLLLSPPSDVATAPESAVSKADSAADQIEKRDRRGAPAMHVPRDEDAMPFGDPLRF